MLLGLGGGCVGAVVAYHLFGHVRQRVSAWRDPMAVYQNEGYQIVQSLFAIGTGGWFGMGLCQEMCIRDRYGLDKTDRRILQTLILNFQGGPVGLETLAASIGEDSGTLEDVYEPYLLQTGFLNRTPRGRMASVLAYTHLG